MLKKHSSGALRNTHGFTLTELMVVVGIGVVLCGFSYAGFSSWQKKECVRSANYQLSALLKEARFRSIEQDEAHAVEAVDNTSTGTKQLILSKGATEIRRFDLGKLSYKETPTHTKFVFNSKGCVSPMPNLGFKNDKGFFCKVTGSRIGRIKVECKDDETYGIN